MVTELLENHMGLLKPHVWEKRVCLNRIKKSIEPEYKYYLDYFLYILNAGLFSLSFVLRTDVTKYRENRKLYSKITKTKLSTQSNPTQFRF